MSKEVKQTFPPNVITGPIDGVTNKVFTKSSRTPRSDQSKVNAAAR